MYLVAAGLVSVAAGLLFALVAFGIVVIFAGSPTEGGYCSNSGIGDYEVRSSAKVVAYIDQGWSGFPPGQHCSVYLIAATDDNPPLSGEELLRREASPHQLLAEGTYPGTREYAWIVGAFLLPFGFSCLLLAMAAFSRRRMAPEG